MPDFSVFSTTIPTTNGVAHHMSQPPLHTSADSFQFAPSAIKLDHHEMTASFLPAPSPSTMSQLLTNDEMDPELTLLHRLLGVSTNDVPSNGTPSAVATPNTMSSSPVTPNDEFSSPYTGIFATPETSTPIASTYF
eukprot:TRINITY_DN2492_c0_g1_i4.p1 TRINITY_DN2492_c0_g1~~TRINITY_DN2492_c0_g1_i4.p1  ORF type:complete len:136 (+),score=35.37 TRINITY_DN2492_c0_g1_i4:142-549(+)